jgi:hypothetical protein
MKSRRFMGALRNDHTVESTLTGYCTGRRERYAAEIGGRHEQASTFGILSRMLFAQEVILLPRLKRNPIAEARML